MVTKTVGTPQGTIQRDYTEEEEEQRVIDIETWTVFKEAEDAAKAQKATDKASAISKLEALGLSISEIDALTKIIT